MNHHFLIDGFQSSQRRSFSVDCFLLQPSVICDVYFAYLPLVVYHHGFDSSFLSSVLEFELPALFQSASAVCDVDPKLNHPLFLINCVILTVWACVHEE